MGTLTKTRALIDLVNEDEDYVYFGRDDEEDRTYLLQMEKYVWEDLGKPKQITIEIIPGDELN